MKTIKKLKPNRNNIETYLPIFTGFYRPLLIKTLLSSDQVTDLITTVPKYEKVYRKNVMRWAIDDFLGNHNIKL